MFVDATSICTATKGAHTENSYYVSHPYNCHRYIWCASSVGYDNKNLDCHNEGSNKKFKPDYADDKHLCSENVPQCIET